MLTLADLVERFADTRVLVVGEACLDGWLSGPADRLSREAPVPVVRVTETVLVPGAAANTAVNLAALGATVQLVSVVGDDDDGEALRSGLRERGVAPDSVVAEPGRHTLAKRRVLAGLQMLTRVDTGDTRVPGPGAEATLVASITAADAEVVVVSDYDGGVFTPAVRDAVVRAAAGRLLVVDARSPARWAGTGAAAVKPNAAEVEALLGVSLPVEDRPGAVIANGDAVLDRTGAHVAAVTLDSDGAVVLERGRPPYRIWTEPVPHSQAAGGGDTFTAALALALAAGADGPSAGELAAAAAAVAVRRPGTTACSAAELRREVARPGPGGLLDAERLAVTVREHRAAGRRIVFTNGCFDVLHRGHVTYLNRAKELGDVLIVALNSDASTRRLKGPDRPVNPVEDRAAVLAALSCVDSLAVFDGDTAADLLEVVRPDVYVKGGDYTEQMLPEAPLVERLGGEVRILDYLSDRSTTSILARIRAGRP